MRKAKVLVLLIITLMFSLGIAFSQSSEEKKEPAMEGAKKEKQMQNERMAGMVMQMLGAMQKQMVATNDGGVVVLVGNKLFKYDKDLNLVKEVGLNTQFELKLDVGPMRGMMENMKEKYEKNLKAEGQDTEKK